MWPVFLVLYLMIGLVLAVFPFVETTRKYGLFAAAVIWPYLTYEKFSTTK